MIVGVLMSLELCQVVVTCGGGDASTRGMPARDEVCKDRDTVHVLGLRQWELFQVDMWRLLP